MQQNSNEINNEILKLLGLIAKQEKDLRIEIEVLTKLLTTNSIQKKNSLLNKEEGVIEKILGELIKNADIYLAYYPQTPFSAFIKDEAGLFWTYSRWYVDFLICKSHMNNGEIRREPLCVIEYFGGGHYGNSEEEEKNVEKNDRIKELLLQKVKMPLLVIDNSRNPSIIEDSDKVLKDKIKKWLDNVIKNSCELVEVLNLNNPQEKD